MRNENKMEKLDDQMYASWRRRNSVNNDRNAGTRTSNYPRARWIRRLPSRWGLGNWIYAISATRCCRCWPRNSRRHGVSTVCPFIDERKRNYNQTLVSAGRPPPATCSRCSDIEISISANL